MYMADMIAFVIKAGQIIITFADIHDRSFEFNRIHSRCSFRNRFMKLIQARTQMMIFQLKRMMFLHRMRHHCFQFTELLLHRFQLLFKIHHCIQKVLIFHTNHLTL